MYITYPQNHGPKPNHLYSLVHSWNPLYQCCTQIISVRTGHLYICYQLSQPLFRNFEALFRFCWGGGGIFHVELKKPEYPWSKNCCTFVLNSDAGLYCITTEGQGAYRWGWTETSQKLCSNCITSVNSKNMNSKTANHLATFICLLSSEFSILNFFFSNSHCNLELKMKFSYSRYYM